MTVKNTSSKAKKPSQKATKTTELVVKSVVAEIVSDDQEVIDVPTEIDDAATEGTSLSAEIVVPGSSTQLPAITKNLLTMYLNEVRKYPVLSKEEEQRVAKKFYDTKDPAAGELLVKSNLRFVVKVAAEYSKFSNRMIDLIQEGNVGLMHAVKEFNPYKGNRLITYAVWWIRGYMQEIGRAHV